MSLPALRIGRPRGRPPKDWLPFEEARAFARSLGLQGYKEWRAYHRENKLLRLPVNPETVYRNHGYVSMYDWLDYERKSAPPKEESKNLRTPALHMNSKGARWISQILNASETVGGERIQLFVMPHESRFTFLYRMTRPGSNSDEFGSCDWAPFSIRVSARTETFRPLFGGAPRCVDHPLVCADLKQERIYVFPPDAPRSQNAFQPSAADEQRYGAAAADLSSILRAWWASDGAERMRKSIDVWLRESIDHQRCGQWIDWMLQVKDLLYIPLGFRLGFTHNLQQQAHNSFLNGVPVFHQVATRVRSGSLFMHLEKSVKMHRRAQLPFTERGKIDFAICGVRKDESADLTGIFCFPRKTLLERGIFGSKTDPGRTLFTVFPPSSSNHVSRFKKSREAAAWQREFYIDLSDLSPEKMADAQNKLQEILSQNSSVFASN